MVDVVLVRWPAEAPRLEKLRNEGVPRLLLVEGGAPPVVSEIEEDWIRLPAEQADIRSRIEGLRSRLSENNAFSPRIDDADVLRVGSHWVSLSPIESRITRLLLEERNRVVSRTQLARAGWPERAPDRNNLDVQMLRLRRRLAPLGLTIKTVRSRGYILD